jgi:hypothetical protein
MRYFLDDIKKNLILRKPRSGCLEGRTVLIPAAYRKIHELRAVQSHKPPPPARSARRTANSLVISEVRRSIHSLIETGRFVVRRRTFDAVRRKRARRARATTGFSAQVSVSADGCVRMLDDTAGTWFYICSAILETNTALKDYLR